MNVNVKNLNGTTGRTPCDGSTTWLEYWSKKMDYRPAFCACQDCFSGAEVGGHVKKANLHDDSWYIVPLCKKCNKRTEDFAVDQDYLVPVNPQI